MEMVQINALAIKELNNDERVREEMIEMNAATTKLQGQVTSKRLCWKDRMVHAPSPSPH